MGAEQAVRPGPGEIDVARAVAAVEIVDPTGAGTHREVGGPAPTEGQPVRAPAGVVAYDPADLTVCVGAGTSVRELTEVLAEHDQECALDPRDAAATVGGTLAAGLSGVRRLRVGPLRDQVLEVRFVTGDGRLVRGGGPTVKNVTGYDLPRLMVGSLGTLGVLTRLVLRCRPRPARSWWGSTPEGPEAVFERCFRAAAVLWDGATTRVLLEGNADDVDTTAKVLGLTECEAPAFPAGRHRGRASVAAASTSELARSLAPLGEVQWLAEIGVGTVHLASTSQLALARARDATHRVGGWMLREAGAPELDGYGIELPNATLMARVRAAFDPVGKLAPGRLPISRSQPEGEIG